MIGDVEDSELAGDWEPGELDKLSRPVKEPMRPKPSDDFVEIVSNGYSIVADCGLCGRVCFENSEFADWNLGEFDDLMSKRENDPERYVALDRIKTGIIDGKMAVANCPCNGLRRFENFIWSHRKLIGSYVQKRTERMAELALKDEADAELLKDFLTRSDMEKTFQKCQGCFGYFDKDCMDEKLMCPGCSRERNADEEKHRSSKIESAMTGGDDPDFPF